MSSTIVSLRRSGVHRPAERHRRCQLKRLAQPSRQAQISSDGSASVAAFERFMNWLGPNQDLAGEKYESIRGRLITMFKARQCLFAEDLADATIERVARKLSDLTFGFTGDPALYFYGVAKKIYLEYQRKLSIDRRTSRCLPLAVEDNPDLEELLSLLDEALNAIPKFDRELILRYYSGSAKNKINDRRALAAQLGIGANTLRLRVFRIRKEIKNYMLQSGKDICSLHV